MKNIFAILFCSLLTLDSSFAETPKDKKTHLKAEIVGHEATDESHEAHEKHSDDKDHEDHASGVKDDHDKSGHADHKESGHGDHEESAEENPQVGEGKGITAASPEQGFKLSNPAIKNFEIETFKIQNVKSITISKKAIVTAGDEVNIFRLRDGFFKRIDFDVIKKEATQITIKSKDLKISDEIVINGTGFLRIAEIAAFGGAPEGHSH